MYTSSLYAVETERRLMKYETQNSGMYFGLTNSIVRLLWPQAVTT
jgi:hypothetical protein